MFKLLLIAALALAYVHADSNPEDAHAEIVELAAEVKEDGHYNYAYETTNHIKVEESGLGGHEAHGSYEYLDPHGEHIHLVYKADENGFQPSGDHLPVAPPVPHQILEALEYINSHPQYEESHH